VPTYAYVCTACDHSFEVVQAITDDALTACPDCGGALRKKFHPVGVTFKGSGFYRTDSRSGSSSSTDGASKESSGAGAGSKESSGASESAGGGTPAKTKDSSSSSSSSGTSGSSSSSSSSSGTSGSSSS
jgi:putative FmdB family regulatory protein